MTDAGMQPTLKVEGLTKKFAEHTLWSRLSFDAGPGSIIAVSGPSGAGKTTLLNCIGLLEDFNEGSVTYNERTFRSGYLHKSRKGQRVCLRENIGFLFQNYGLVEQWNVSRNLQIPLKMKKREHRKERDEQIDRVLDIVGMNGSQKKKIYTLSGGEQQRIALARLLLKQPSVILADEPTSALDQDNANVVIRILCELAQQGAAVIISTHNEEIKQICSSIIEIG